MDSNLETGGRVNVESGEVRREGCSGGDGRR